jgi:hypothetical protein
MRLAMNNKRIGDTPPKETAAAIAAVAAAVT